MKDTTLTKAELRAENEMLRIDINRKRKEIEVLTCKILTCGVAAEHKDPELSKRARDYGGPWDSPQAQRVRELRDSRDRLREAVKERDDALMDLLDGASPWDVQEAIGLPLARCEELCEMRRYTGA